MKMLTRELDFTESDPPHPEARPFIERGSIDCTRCLPSVHRIVSHSSGEVEGDPYTIVSYKCMGRKCAVIFEDPADTDDPSGDGVMEL